MRPESLQQQLHLWPGLEGGKATLVNLSENHTFRIDTPDGAKHIIRVHRPGYQSRVSIESELNWLAALRDQTDIPVVQPLKGADGEFLQEIVLDDGTTRSLAVRFAFEEGAIAETLPDLTGLFGQLGRLAALCHQFVEHWSAPHGFFRPIWDTGAILNPDGLWGDWRQAPHVAGEVRAVLDRLDERLRQQFAAYGAGNDVFGLIHADMRLANLIVNQDHVRLIDFDDSGFSWFVYDFGAAVSFFEDSPDVPGLRAEWLEAYRRIRPFSIIDQHMLDAAVLLRRMALLAWIGSHHEVELARHHAPQFAGDSATLAEKYLTRGTID